LGNQAKTASRDESDCGKITQKNTHTSPCFCFNGKPITLGEKRAVAAERARSGSILGGNSTNDSYSDLKPNRHRFHVAIG
jgi:hypothetical protein